MYDFFAYVRRRIHSVPKLNSKIEIKRRGLAVFAVVVPIHEPRSDQVLVAFSSGGFEGVTVSDSFGEASQVPQLLFVCLVLERLRYFAVFAAFDEVFVGDISDASCFVCVSRNTGQATVDADETW